MGDRNLSAGGMLVVTQGTGDRNLSAQAVYVVTAESADRNLSAQAAYIVSQPSPGPITHAAGNLSVYFAGLNLAGHADRARLIGSVRAWESTVNNSTGAQFVPTTAGWTCALGGMWEPVLDDLLGVYSVIARQGPLTVAVGPVRYAWTTAQLTDYTVTSEARGAGLVWLATLQPTGIAERYLYYG